MAARKKSSARQTKTDPTDARRKQASIGAEAKALLDNEMLRGSLQALGNVYVAEFRKATTPDEAWRAKQMCDAHEQFTRQLVTLVTAGQNALDLLQHEQELQADQPEAYDFDAYRQRAIQARQEWAAKHGGLS